MALHARAYGLQPIDQVFVSGHGHPCPLPVAKHGQLLPPCLQHCLAGPLRRQRGLHPHYASSRAWHASFARLQQCNVGPFLRCPLARSFASFCILRLVPAMQCWLFYAFSSRQIDYKNTHGLALEALEGRGIGFAGKQVIHPLQIGGVQASATRKGTASPCWILGTSAPLPCGALSWVSAAHYLIPFWANPAAGLHSAFAGGFLPRPSRCGGGGGAGGRL